MKAIKIVCHLKLATVMMLLVVVSAFGSTDKSVGKKITFTTKSKEAVDSVAQAVQIIETFQFGPQFQAVAEKAVKADPDFAFGYYLLGTALLPAPEAKTNIDKAVELSKKASEGERRYIEAVLLTRAGKHDEAITILTDLAKKYPADRMVQMMLGQVYLVQNKLDESRAAFERAIQIDGSTPRAYSFLGNIELLKGDYAKSRETFKAALGKKAEGTAPFGPYTGIAYSYIYEGNPQAAIKALQEFESEYTRTGGPKNFPAVFIWNSIARVYLENGQPEEAVKYYEKGYATVPDSSIDDMQKKIWLGRLHHGKGRALAKMGKYEEAWKEAEIIKKMIDEGGEQGQQFVPSYHYLAGYLKLESGDYQAAIEHLKQTDLTDPFHQLLLARAYEKAGDKANAEKVYQEIVSSSQVTIERALSYPEAKKKLKG